MERESLVSTLSLLRQGRSRLATRFTSRDVELFSDMFRFERSPALMALAIDRFNVSWISEHYELLDTADGAVTPAAETAFKACVLALLDRIEQGREGDLSAEWALVKNLISEKKALLAAQFDFSKKDDLNYKKLVLSQHREAALFERIFAQQTEK